MSCPPAIELGRFGPGECPSSGTATRKDIRGLHVEQYRTLGLSFVAVAEDGHAPA